MIPPSLSHIRVQLTLHGADAFLLVNAEYSGQPGTRYLSGFSGSTSVLIVSRDGAWLLTDGRYATQAKNETTGIDCITISRAGYLEEAIRLLEHMSCRALLFDSARTSYASIGRLETLLPALRFAPVPNILQEIRLVKDAAEIACVQSAIEIASAAFHRLLTTIRVGQTERFLAAQLEFFMKEAGAEKIAFDTICVSGVRGSLPHGQPSEKQIAAGELISFDFGAVNLGYACDITRTVAVGEPPAQLRDIYECVRQAQEHGCRVARAGVSGKEVDAACREVIRQKGYGDYFLHATGHGLGMEVHELPIVSDASTISLPAGAVVTCEPGIYISGFGGVRIEDDLLLTDTGNVNMSAGISRELLMLSGA